MKKPSDTIYGLVRAVVEYTTRTNAETTDLRAKAGAEPYLEKVARAFLVAQKLEPSAAVEALWNPDSHPAANADAPQLPAVIVAEVSKNYEQGKSDTHVDSVAVRFERVIARNLKRGYGLHSYQLTSVAHLADPRRDLPATHTDTIVGLFVRQQER